MKTSIGLFLVIFFFAVAIGVSNAFSQTPAGGQGDPGSLVMKACTKCHNTKRICTNLGNKSAEQWDITITRMMGKGVPLEEAQKQTLRDYLADLAPGSAPVCP